MAGSGKIANLSVGVSLDKSEFSRGLTKAEAEAQAFSKRMSGIGARAGTMFGTALAAGVSAAGAALVVFDQLAKGAGQFSDLADMTGASAEALASYAVAAATAGVSIDSVAGFMNKMSKNLVGVDDESKAAGAALKALGINVEDFKKLDPAAQYEAVSKAMAGFADGSGKVAIAMALGGKAGAEQLKVFKAMEEQGGRLTILTQKQIEQADAYADKQAKVTAELLLYAQAAAGEMAPAMTDLTTALADVFKELIGVDAATGRLATNNGLQDFAESAADAMAFVADAVQGVWTVISRTGEFLGATGAAIVAKVKGDTAALKAIQEDYNKSLETGFRSVQSRLQDQRARRKAADAAAANMQGPPSSLAGSGKPALDYDGGKAAKKAKDAAEAAAKKAKAAAEQADKQAKKYIDDLNKQIEKTQELSAVQQVAADVAAKRVKFSGGQRGEADAAAARIDAHKEELRRLDELSEAQEEVIADRQRAGEAAAAEAASLVKSNEALLAEIESIGVNRQGLLALEQARIANTIATKQSSLAELEAGGVTTAASAAIRDEIVALQERAGLLVKREAADEAAANLQRIADKAKEVEQSIEQTLGSQLSDILGGNFDDIGKQWATLLQRMVADALAADLMASLTGKQGGNTAGLWSGLAGLASSIFGGGGFTGAPGKSSVDFGLASGTNYVPRDMTANLHKGEAVVPAAYNPAVGGGAVAVKLENNGPPLRAEARSERQPDGTQLVKIVLSAVAADIKQGGKVGGAMSDQYGLKRNLPRRA